MAYKVKTDKEKEKVESYEVKESEYDKQANKFLKDTNTNFQIKYLKHDSYFDDNDLTARDIYEFTLTKDGKTYSGTFGQSIEGSKKGEVPSAYSVLSSLSGEDGDENETFEEFADNFGYDQDSRKAEKIYHAVIKERKGIHNLYSEEELEKLREIQ